MRNALVCHCAYTERQRVLNKYSFDKFKEAYEKVVE